MHFSSILLSPSEGLRHLSHTSEAQEHQTPPPLINTPYPGPNIFAVSVIKQHTTQAHRKLRRCRWRFGPCRLLTRRCALVREREGGAAHTSEEDIVSDNELKVGLKSTVFAAGTCLIKGVRIASIVELNGVTRAKPNCSRCSHLFLVPYAPARYSIHSMMTCALAGVHRAAKRLLLSNVRRWLVG